MHLIRYTDGTTPLRGIRIEGLMSDMELSSQRQCHIHEFQYHNKIPIDMGQAKSMCTGRLSAVIGELNEGKMITESVE